MRAYSDTELAAAVQASHSWRGVLRALGLTATSASAMRSVRRHTVRLGLDHTHFTGQRRWTDEQLREAVADARSWSQVAEALALSGGSSTTTLKGHALRLGIDTAHLARPRVPTGVSEAGRPDPANVSRAGPLLAAAWFELSGQSVSWPLEPVRYDLLVWRTDRAHRVQVKTATVRAGRSWTVWLSTTGRARRPYDPDEIDEFFVIDGDLQYYLIPIAVVGGFMTIQVSAYQAFRLPES
jgi:hypothetical protein